MTCDVSRDPIINLVSCPVRACLPARNGLVNKDELAGPGLQSKHCDSQLYAVQQIVLSNSGVARTLPMLGHSVRSQALRVRRLQYEIRAEGLGSFIT